MKKSKKTKRMKKGGDLLAMFSPVAAFAQTMKSGSPVGLAKLSPLAHAISSGADSSTVLPEEEAKRPQRRGAMVRPALPVRGMKKGGSVRGDGICQRGKTKGRMV